MSTSKVYFAPRQRIECDLCIYCGHRGTTIEHVIPLWAGGNLELLNGSCGTCATLINKEIENVMARGPFWSARLYLGLKSRSKHREPLPITLLHEDGTEQLVRVTAELNPAVICMPSQPGPFIRSEASPREPKGPVQMTFHTHVFDLDVRARFERTHLSQSWSPGWFPIIPFTRLLAKICHGHAVFTLGARAFTPLLRNFILRGASLAEAHFFVGGGTDYFNTTDLHQVSCYWETIRGFDYLMYDVALFACAEMPFYTVAVGTRPSWSDEAGFRTVWGLGN